VTSTQGAALSTQGVTICRGCGEQALHSVLDLGEQPLANELLPAADTPDAVFPLHLRICAVCGLGQLGEFVAPERIFGDYPYLSSVSTSWVTHARGYAKVMYDELGLADGGLVVEVASNDGYLLHEFRELGVEVLGVEPAANVAKIATDRGVPTINAFFGRETARHLVDEHGRPRLVVANNVLAHVPDLDDFVGGFAILCGDDTTITVENPSFVTLLTETQFDTIYHEHYSYLSAHAVARLVEQHGLELVRVEELTTHGGSYRYWIRKAGVTTPDPGVAQLIGRELAAGLLSPQAWQAFEGRSLAAVRGLQAWLAERSAAGARVAAYGAAAKGNTLLNAAGVRAGDLLVVADGSREKQGRWLPGSRVPIVAPSALAESTPTDVLVLPWNIAGEIVAVLADLVPDATAWAAIPEMRTLPR
jgi:C-methyltransferase C-terminal domain/Putative zinc binding domain/Methyltransferase domain